MGDLIDSTGNINTGVDTVGKAVYNEKLNVTGTDLTVINAVVYGVIPAVILIFGIIMFMKRRNR